MEEAVANERRLSQQLNSSVSEEEQNRIKRTLAELEKELAHKKTVHEQTRKVCQAMENEIQLALDALDASESKMEAMAAESGAFRESSSKTIEALQERNRQVEAALDEMKRKMKDTGGCVNTSDVGQAVINGLDHVLETLKKTNETVT
jgi:chromosome segregation ATPase